MNKKPWYKDDNVIIFTMSLIAFALVLALIYLMEMK